MDPDCTSVDIGMFQAFEITVRGVLIVLASDEIELLQICIYVYKANEILTILTLYTG